MRGTLAVVMVGMLLAPGCLGLFGGVGTVLVTVVAGPSAPSSAEAPSSSSSTSGAAGLGLAALLAGLQPGAPERSNDHHGWTITPDVVMINVTSIMLTEGPPEDPRGESRAEFPGGCMVAIERSAPSLQPLASCPPVSVREGTYRGITIGFSGTTQITIDNARVGVYTDAARDGLTTERPAGGATPITRSGRSGAPDGMYSTSARIPEPLTVQNGTTIPVYVIANIVHSLDVLFDPRPRLGDYSGWTNTPPPGSLVPTTRIGGVSRYSSLETADDVPANLRGFALTVYEGSAGYIDMVDTGGAASPKGPCDFRSLPSGHPTTGERLVRHDVGRVGVDKDGVLGVAVPIIATPGERQDAKDGYFAYYRLELPTEIGQSGTFSCKLLHGGQPPAPPDGVSYASGAPPIEDPDDTFPMTLVSR